MSKLLASKVHDTRGFGLRDEEPEIGLRPNRVKAFYEAVADTVPASEGVPPFDLEWWLRTAPFREVEVEFDTKAKVVWQFMKFRRRPSVTLELLREIKQILEMMRSDG